MKVHEERALDLVMELMAVPGPSCQERAIADKVTQILLSAGVPAENIVHDSAHKKTPLPGEVGNLIVKLPSTQRHGTPRQPRIMLSAHLDTVPLCVGCQPRRSKGYILSSNPDSGLGGDDRAGVAVVLVALLELLESRTPHPPLTLCFFVQEEIGLQGSRHLGTAKLGKPAMAFNFDGGDPYKLTIGATSGERFAIRLQGVPAHAGLAPEAGASAIHAAGLAIADLQKHGWLGRVSKQRRVGTSNIGVIQGGSATNVVADLVEIQAEARSHDSQFRQTIADAIEQAFVKAAAAVVNTSGTAVRAEVQRRVDYDAFRLSDDALAVRLAKAAVAAVGATASLAVTDGGVDANWLVKHGIPTVTLGCGQRQVHTRDEQLNVADYLQACRIARSIIEYASR